MKRRENVTLVLSLGTALVLVWLVLGMALPAAGAQGPEPAATTRYVAPGGACGGVIPCYAGVQAAVNAAAAGDEIRVAQGAYSGVSARAGVTQVVYISKTLTLRGGYTLSNWSVPYPQTQTTTLDAQGLGRVLFITGTITPTIQGLQMTGGSAAGLKGSANGYDAGGAVYIGRAQATLNGNVIMNSSSSPTTTVFHEGGGVYLYRSQSTLSYNTIMSNTSKSGSAVYMERSAGTMEGNTLWHNTGPSGSSAAVHLYHSGATLTANQIISNTGGFGGAIYVHGGTEDPLVSIIGNNLVDNSAGFGGGVMVNGEYVLIKGNTITGNRASFGGGLQIRLPSSGSRPVTVEDNLIVYNNGSIGGGVYLGETPIILRRNIIRFNTATFEGGGMVMSHSGSPWLENNVIADNNVGTWADGSGILIDSASPHMIHTTIARNGGGASTGVQVENYADISSVFMTNTIIMGHSVGITVSTGNNVAVNGVLWANNGANKGGGGAFSQVHSYTGSPAFRSDGYHLLSGSPAIDWGVLTLVAEDADGETRPYGTYPDLGADEWMPFPVSIYLPVIMGAYSPH